MHPIQRTLPSLLTVALALVSTAAAAQHAHTHGLAALDVAVDAKRITAHLEIPMDSLVGFERAPRTDAERLRTASALGRLRNADQWIQPDPAAACVLDAVRATSAVLGLGEPAPAAGHAATKAEAHAEGEKHAHGESHHHEEAHAEGEQHADVELQITWNCPRAAKARYVDVNLFRSFPDLHRIEAQVAAPQGQFKRTLQPGAPRLRWAR